MFEVRDTYCVSNTFRNVLKIDSPNDDRDTHKSTMFSTYQESGPALFRDAVHKLQASFRLSNSNETIANTIRRSILSLTPSVGFRTEPYEKSDVLITTNTTPLVNEMLAHRVGMIPICVTDIAKFDPSQYEFVIDKENDTKEIMDVRASDFKVFMKNPQNPLDEPVQLPTEEYFPPDPITKDTVLITRLRPQWNPTAPNERLVLKAKASISVGAENIRWSPVSQISYEYTRDDDEEHMKEVFDAWLLNTKKIADRSQLAAERADELHREFNTMEIQRCYLKNERGEPYDFTFYIESVGVQPNPMIVKNGLAACEGLVSKYVDMDQYVPDNVTLRSGDSRFPSIDVVFQNEGHTLGNLLQTYLVNNHIDADHPVKIVSAGYKIPHPLRSEMFVRIGMPEDATDPETQKNLARQAIATVCRTLKDEFRALTASWATLTESENRNTV